MGQSQSLSTGDLELTGRSYLWVFMCDYVHCACVSIQLCLPGACMQCVLGCLCMHDVSVCKRTGFSSVSQQGLHHAKYFSYSVSSLIHTWMMHPGSIHSELIPFLNSALLRIHTVAYIHTWELPDTARLLICPSEQLLAPMRITPHHAKPLLTSYWHSDKCNETACRRLAWDICMCCVCVTNFAIGLMLYVKLKTKSHPLTYGGDVL